MKRNILGFIALLVIAIIGMTSCNKKDEIPATPTSTPSKALVGKWRVTDDFDNWDSYYDYCDITFNTDGSGIFEAYEEDNGYYELSEKEMFTYIYYEEDGSFVIPEISEFNYFILSIIDSYDTGYEYLSSAYTIKSLTSQSFLLTDYKANSGKAITFKRIN